MAGERCRCAAGRVVPLWANYLGTCMQRGVLDNDEIKDRHHSPWGLTAPHHLGPGHEGALLKTHAIHCRSVVKD